MQLWLKRQGLNNLIQFIVKPYYLMGLHKLKTVFFFIVPSIHGRKQQKHF